MEIEFLFIEFLLGCSGVCRVILGYVGFRKFWFFLEFLFV